MARERFVDSVVDDLVDHVVEARAIVGVADIHARSLAHGIKALENLDGFGTVIGRVRGSLLAGVLGHSDFQLADEKARNFSAWCGMKNCYRTGQLTLPNILIRQ